MRFDELLEAAGGDRSEALRLLFVLAKRCADAPEDAVVTGPELAAILASLLEGESTTPPEAWKTAQRLVTIVGPGPAGPTPTAATVVEAIDEILNGTALELAPDDDRYDHKDLLGIGGMGQVHRVFDRRLRRSVALKALHHGVSGLASAHRFALEAELTAQLDHPNIVPLYDFDRGADGGLFFTMKEVEGRCLTDVIDDARHAVRKGADPTTEILRMVRMFRQVCDGVAFAHDQGIAHRDLKPDNVMIGDFGEVQVMDWGLAKRFGEPLESVAGTPGYMAPELMDGEADTVSAGPDIYALGATLRQILDAAQPVPAELEAVAARAMAPQGRYADVAAVAEDVQAWLDGRPLASLSYGRGALIAKWMRRNRRIVQAIAVTVAAAGLVGAVGAIRYVQDITEARDEARRQQQATQTERDRAVLAETTALERLVEAQLSAARASTETNRYSRAHALYQSAAAELEKMGGPQLGTEIGLLDNHERAVRPLFTIPLPEAPAALIIDPVHGWLVSVDPGQPIVAREAPLFETVWKSSVVAPTCLASAVRWEANTFALYCVTEEQVDRLDLGSGESRRVTATEGLPAVIDAPAFTDLIFVGIGDRDDWTREPMLRWRAVAPAEGEWRTLQYLDVNEISAARGPWFIAERYALGHGTVLFHAERGKVRTLGLPLAKGTLSRAGRHVATYHERTYLLSMEPLEGGPPLWTIKPENPLVVRTFAPDDRSLFAAGESPTILELSAADGSLLRSFDGHTEPVREIVATDDLVISRSLDETIRGFSRRKPTNRLEGSTLGLVPPGDILVASGGPRELQFVDVATRKVLRRVDLPMFEDGEDWEAESVQRDGALVVSEKRIVFVPLDDGPPRQLVVSDGPILRAGDRLDDGHIAYCRDSDVILRDPEGVEHKLGSIHREICRDLRIAAPDAIYVSDFWDFSVHRFGLGRDGAHWSRKLEFTVFRLDVGAGLVSVGDWTGRVTAYDAKTGETVLSEDVVEGPAMGNAMTADARYMAVGGWDQRVAILDMETGQSVAEDARHGAPVEWVRWTADERHLISADPDAAVIRDLDLPAALQTSHDALTDLASDPAREREPAEWDDIAVGLAANGLWARALQAAARGERMSQLQLARWHWLAGDKQAAADGFAQIPSHGKGALYRRLCEAAARAE